MAKLLTRSKLAMLDRLHAAGALPTRAMRPAVTRLALERAGLIVKIDPKAVWPEDRWRLTVLGSRVYVSYVGADGTIGGR